MKGVDVTWLNTVGHGDLEAAVWRTEAIEEAARAIVNAAGDIDGVASVGRIAVPVELVQQLSRALRAAE